MSRRRYFEEQRSGGELFIIMWKQKSILEMQSGYFI